MTTKHPPDQPTGENRPTDGQPNEPNRDPVHRESTRKDPVQAYRRFAGHAILVVAGLAILGFLPTRNLAGNAGLASMALALLADLAASAVGTLPIWWSRHQHPSRSIPHQLGAMAFRLLVVLLLGISFALSGLVHVPAFLIWLAIGHSGLLIADTVFARAITSYAMQHLLPTSTPSARSES